MYGITHENHCTRTARSSRGGCSLRVYKIVYQAVYKGYILVNFYFWKYSLRIIITYISNCVSAYQNFCGLSESRYSAIVMPECDFFPGKRFAYVLEFMLTFDKMQTTNPLMCTNFEIWGQDILEVIQAFHTVCIVMYIGCSGPVVECLSKINMNQSTTRPLGQNTRYTELCVQYEKLE